MERFLTTEEILLAITHKYNTPDEPIAKKEKNKAKKILNKYVIYWSIVFIAVLHLVFAAIPLLIKDKGLSLLGYRYEITYQFNEETAPEYPLFIAVHHKFSSSKAQEGDLILVFARFGTKYYNIEEVYDVDIENNQIESTFDGATTNIYDLDDIEAVYVRRANQIETLYYIFGTIRGYIMLIIGNLVVFGGVYTFYIQPNPILKKKNKKEITDEKNEE